MSELDVHRIICPVNRYELAAKRVQLRQAEQKLVALRSMLRAHKPELPHPYDGAGWEPFETEWQEDAA